MIILAGDSYTAHSGARYLNVFSATRAFSISSKNQGLDETTVKAGYTYNLERFTEIVFHNRGTDDLNIDFELSDLQIMNGGNTAVEIGNEPWIAGLRNPISVVANATVDNGNMSKNVSNNFAPIPAAKVTIADGQTVEVFAARAALNRKVTLQLVTNSLDDGKIRIGDSAVNATATKGFFVAGNLDAAGGYEWETETPVFVHNYSGGEIELAGGEIWRS